MKRISLAEAAVIAMTMITFVVCAALLTSCHSMVIDPSMTAKAAHDQTMIVSACHAAPSQGVDVCRVKEGARIAEKMIFVVPWTKDSDWGQMSVRYRDHVLTLPIEEAVVEVGFAEVTDEETWTRAAEAPIQALASIRYKTDSGAVFVDLIGYVFPIVLAQGYDPLPMDSGVEAFQNTCRVQYTSAGRSAIECRKQ